MTMVGRKKKSGHKPELLGSHQRSWVWGRNLVLEILRAGRWVPHELLLADELTHAPPGLLKCTVGMVNYRLAIYILYVPSGRQQGLRAGDSLLPR